MASGVRRLAMNLRAAAANKYGIDGGVQNTPEIMSAGARFGKTGVDVGYDKTEKKFFGVLHRKGKSLGSFGNVRVE